MHPINYFLLDKGHPMLNFTAVGTMLYSFAVMLCTQLKWKKVCRILNTYYFYVHVIGVVVVYLNVLPDWLQGP